ncbi:uncharacterized protein N7498_001639 [Penicillium cinerascens]|uniref:Reverse transcriptase Ty1/copia-type domain-containing protein n=1 Tax=Penicillium cinerascens TaxID=70096 RepID=A0A9W9N8L5_9EURO|nr:uncharacterized protein N7498_001639 [Penicillium cinerascens]KAJ5215232.1 hypothetical protein N7498_001639 [Penicillium cinerascens]
MTKELDSLRQKETYEVVEKPKDRGKRSSHSFGPESACAETSKTISLEENRAATLAARTARMIFALVAAFDLDLRQRDAVTAFLNSRLNKEIYAGMPEGFTIPGMCWKLVRALYGLRMSPRLWQQEAAAVLSKLGLQPVPEDPCIFVGKEIIVFFYVHDILIACHWTARERARQLERDLEAHWELTDHGEAEWFLNILGGRIHWKVAYHIFFIKTEL